VIDTAGIRETDDPIEQEGVRRARARAEDADLVLWLVDAMDAKPQYDSPAPLWTVRNKIDLDSQELNTTDPRSELTDPAPRTAGRHSEQGRAGFEISAARGDGLAGLIAALVVFAQEFFGQGEGGLIIRQRQRDLLRQAAASLQRSIAMFAQGEEFAAEDLRAAAFTLGRLLGRVDVEDILDVIFREFCIGK
jgi:tRNA modification GTPase